MGLRHDTCLRVSHANVQARVGSEASHSYMKASFSVIDWDADVKEPFSAMLQMRDYILKSATIRPGNLKRERSTAYPSKYRGQPQRSGCVESSIQVKRKADWESSKRRKKEEGRGKQEAQEKKVDVSSSYRSEIV